MKEEIVSKNVDIDELKYANEKLSTQKIESDKAYDALLREKYAIFIEKSDLLSKISKLTIDCTYHKEEISNLKVERDILSTTLKRNEQQANEMMQNCEKTRQVIHISDPLCSFKLELIKKIFLD